MRIEVIIKKRELTQIEAAKILGMNQPKISALVNGRLSGFSIERLIHFLNRFDQNVKIVVSPKSGRRTSQGYFKFALG